MAERVGFGPDPNFICVLGYGREMTIVNVVGAMLGYARMA